MGQVTQCSFPQHLWASQRISGQSLDFIFKASYSSWYIQNFQGKPVQELYIFKDLEKPAKEVPVVLLFSLVNRDFRNYSAPGVPRESNKEFAFSNFEYFDNRWDYGTLRFTYPELAMERLTKNIDFNIQNNLELIKQEIMEVVIQRRNDTSEMTHL